MSLLIQRFETLQERIQQAKKLSKRESQTINLLAISKRQSAAAIRTLFSAGQDAFGENYLQEALAKQQQLSDLAITWHFIGAIQSNKTRQIAQHFSWVQSLSDLRIAERLNAERPENLPPLNCCIQINISQEPSKAGILAEALPSLAQAMVSLPGLRLRGLMALPAQRAPLSQYETMHTLFAALQKEYPWVDTLSMGMSADLELAVAQGTTLLRIGTALFGERGNT